MKKIPLEIEMQFLILLNKKMPQMLHSDYLKWLMFYLFILVSLGWNFSYLSRCIGKLVPLNQGSFHKFLMYETPPSKSICSKIHCCLFLT